MPPKGDSQPPEISLAEIVESVGLYPIEAFKFVQEGLSYTVEKEFNAKACESPAAGGARAAGEPQEVGTEVPTSRHVDGRQLCQGLREYALMNWGLLARTVLSRWNIRRTIDFGRIVFALVDHGHMQKTDEDTVDDFRDVYDFAHAFEEGYRIEQKTI